MFSKFLTNFLSLRLTKIISVIVGIVITFINIYFVAETIIDLHIDVYIYIPIGILTIIYFAFVIYLVVHFYVSLGGKSLEEHPWIQKYVIFTEMNTPHAIKK